MIGFALTLVGAALEPDGFEKRTFVALATAIAHENGLSVDAAAVDAAARRFAAVTAPQDRAPALVDAFAEATGTRPPSDVLVSRFRSLGETLAERDTRPRPGAVTLLGRLAELRLPHAVMAGGWSGIDHRRASALGLCGELVVAEDVGAAVPEPAAFASLAETLMLPADRIWFVGTDPAGEIDPAVRFGFRTIWLNPAGAPFPAELRAPERVVGSLDELTPLICEAYTRGLLDLRYLLHSTLRWRSGHFVPGVEYGLNDPARLSYVLPEEPGSS